MMRLAGADRALNDLCRLYERPRNGQMLPAMLSKQKPDGSFFSSPSSRGQSEEINDTAMGVLILETYYRGELDALTPR